jgi:hypothetical protein
LLLRWQTIFGLIPGEMLVTYTASCLDEQFPELEETFKDITASFKISSK